MTTFIDEGRRFFFVHVPKTGGMSVTSLFASGRGRTWRQELSPLNEGIGIHDGVLKVQSKLGDRTSDFFSFAFYRNTWDWLFSLFRYIKRTTNHPWHARVHKLSFEDFVFDIAAEFYRPQKPLVAIGNVVAVSRLEDFANVEQAMKEILGELDIDTKRLKPKNAAPERSGYREQYTRAMAARVAEIYEEDIEFFGFRF